jgi:hypothetical protein
MDIFEQLEQSHILYVNGCATQNYGWNPDDPDDEWCCSIYGNDLDGQYYEYYFDRDDFEKAKPFGSGFIINDTILEFYKLTPMT